MSEDVVRFSSAEVQLVLHATEDRGRVLASLEKTLSVPAASFEGKQSEGHFGNTIILLGASIASREASVLATRIVSALNRIDRQELADHIEEYSDEKGNLYLRLDKQRLCQGKISLAESDAVRVKFKPIHRYKPSSNLQSYRGLLTSIK